MFRKVTNRLTWMLVKLFLCFLKRFVRSKVCLGKEDSHLLNATAYGHRRQAIILLLIHLEQNVTKDLSAPFREVKHAQGMIFFRQAYRFSERTKRWRIAKIMWKHWITFLQKLLGVNHLKSPLKEVVKILFVCDLPLILFTVLNADNWLQFPSLFVCPLAL